MLMITPETISANEDNPETIRSELKYEENSCVALNYHRVRSFDIFESTMKLLSNSRELSTYSVSERAFREQMEFLISNNAEFVTMEELIKHFEEGEFPERCVWINFDDMDQTIYDNAYPILKEYNIPATGFVITGEVGNTDFNNLELINKENLDEMEESGLWEFGSHTNKLHHLEGNNSVMLSESSNVVKEDLSTSLKYIEENFNTEDSVLAYPYGQANDMVNNIMNDIGIDYGFTLEEEVITEDSNPHYLPRVLVSEAAFDTLIRSWKGFN